MAHLKGTMVQCEGKMSGVAVSIIVPVYKAEAYLKRCVDSIIGQSFENWELLLVDDGSPDGSGDICDAYSMSDARIKVLHKENGGVASAREAGIRNATGTYSIHVDPDDWIEPDTLECMYAKAIETAADVVVCDFLLDYGGNNPIVSSQSFDSSDEVLYKLLCQDLHGSLCNKLIRTELYRRYDLHFPERMICWEDLYICCNIAMHACKLVYIPRAFYHYDLYSNGGSMTRMATMRTLDGMKLFCSYFSERLGPERVEWLNEIKGTVLLTAYRCRLMSAKELRDVYPEINDWFVRKYSRDYKKVRYNALALVLKGRSLEYARRFQSVNSMVQRIRVRLLKILNLIDK